MELTSIVTTWISIAIVLALFFVLFAVLEKYMPCNPGQRYFRAGMLTDLLYAFINPILNRMATVGFLIVGTGFIFHDATEAQFEDYLHNGYGWLSTLELWQQAAIIVLLSDFLLYWIHRGFHTKWLWPFHAIHHSPEELNWLSTYRFHPINSWFAFVLVDALMVLAGFSPKAIASMAFVNMLYSAMVHSNLNWTFGQFRELFASPVFHRWHHTAQEEGMDKNFAPTFPLLDVWFGTFYMPEGRVPEKYGVTGANIPKDYVGQMVWPFRRKK